MKTYSKYIPHVLLGIYIILFAVCAINPYARDVWFAENATVWVVLLAIIISYIKGIRVSNTSYVLMALFLYWHTIGGHYTFERVPFDWFNDLFGFERNMFDRIGHFMVGFYALPIYELLESKGLTKSKTISFLFAFFAIVTVAAVYELFEWQYAIWSDPEAGLAVLGSQGDIWDAQKDMLSDSLGAIVVLVGARIAGCFKK